MENWILRTDQRNWYISLRSIEIKILVYATTMWTTATQVPTSVCLSFWDAALCLFPITFDIRIFEKAAFNLNQWRHLLRIHKISLYFLFCERASGESRIYQYEMLSGVEFLGNTWCALRGYRLSAPSHWCLTPSHPHLQKIHFLFYALIRLWHRSFSNTLCPCLRSKNLGICWLNISIKRCLFF